MSNAVVQDLATILITGSILGWVFKKIFKVPLIIGYIVTGILISLPTPPNLVRPEDTKAISEIGVLLIMFTIGFHFGFRKIKSMGLSPILIALGEISLIGVFGVFILKSIGLREIESLFVGAALLASSSALIFKILGDFKLSNLRFIEKLTSVLVLEDAIVIFVIIALSLLLKDENSIVNFSIYQLVPIFVVGIIAWWILGTLLLPKIIKYLSKNESDELLASFSVGIALGAAFLSSKLQMSSALGAFLVGSILSECREIKKIEKIVTPIKDIFTLIFFVSVGMLFSPHILFTEYKIILLLLGFVIFSKIIFNFILNIIFGNNLKDSLRISGSMAQIGEMAFIIVQLGLQRDVITHEWYSIVIAVSVFSMLLTPIIFKGSLLLSDHSEKIFPKSLQNFLDFYSKSVLKFSLLNTLSPMYQKISLLNRLKKSLTFIYEEFQKNYHKIASSNTTPTLSRLAPWDEYLMAVNIEPTSIIVGKNILELKLREKFTVNIVAIERDLATLVSPHPHTTISGGDTLLVYGSEKDITHLTQFVSTESIHSGPDLEDCLLTSIKLEENHPFLGKTILELSIRAIYSCIVLAIFRKNKKIKNPLSSFRFELYDEIFIFGTKESLKKIKELK